MHLESHPGQLSLDLACRAYRVRVARVLLVLLLDQLSPGSTCWTHRAKAVRVPLDVTVEKYGCPGIVARDPPWWVLYAAVAQTLPGSLPAGSP